MQKTFMEKVEIFVYKYPKLSFTILIVVGIIIFSLVDKI